MPYSLNRKLSELTPYDPIEGEFEIRLDANESCFNLNEVISEKLSEAISDINLNRYPDPYAKKAVKAFSDFYGINEEIVTAGNGSDELISVITSCFLESGDKVITLTPDFSMYAFYGSLYELETLTFQKENDLSVNVDKLISFCEKEKPNMLIFSNPCNPTSLGIEKKDILKLLKKVSCLVVLDEAYMDFWSESVLNEIGNFDNLIILKTCSKAIGLAGIRFGFAVAGKTITSALRAAKSPYNTDSVSQKIVEISFSEKQVLESNTKQLIENNQLLLKKIIELNNTYNKFETVYDSKTNFVFIKTEFAEAIFEKLLEKSIAVRKFNGFLRITSGSKSENEKVIDALKSIMTELK